MIRAQKRLCNIMLAYFYIGITLILAAPRVYGDEKNVTVFLTDQLVSWWDAQIKCEELGGMLSGLQTETELNLVLEEMKTGNEAFVWIGGTQLNMTMNWIDGNKGQEGRSNVSLDNLRGAENCLSLGIDNIIADQNCGLKSLAACTKTVLNCPDGWFISNNKCFKFAISHGKDVRDVCSEGNVTAIMGTITSEDNEAEVANMSHSNEFYIGLYREKDQFVWADQIEGHWKEPIDSNSSYGEDCTIVNAATGKWMTAPCVSEEPKKVLCQFVQQSSMNKFLLSNSNQSCGKSLVEVEHGNAISNESVKVMPAETNTTTSALPSSVVVSTTVALNDTILEITTESIPSNITSTVPTPIVSSTSESDLMPSTKVTSTVGPSITDSGVSQLVNSDDPIKEVLEPTTQLGNTSLSIGLGAFFVILVAVGLIAYMTYYKKIRPSRQFGFRSFDDSFA